LTELIHLESKILLSTYQLTVTSGSGSCKSSKTIVINRTTFCLCENSTSIKNLKKYLKRSLSLLPLNQAKINTSYIISLIFDYRIKAIEDSFIKIRLVSEDLVYLYYTCKLIKLEFAKNLELECVQSGGNKSFSSESFKYELLVNYINQFVLNCNSDIVQRKSCYPTYDRKIDDKETFGGDGLVTLIVPTLLKNEKYLIGMFASVKNSKFDLALTILVTPTGSRLSQKLISTLGTLGTFIILEGSERGVAAARKVGISRVKTQFVVFLDDDDYIASNHLSVLKNALTNNVNLAAVGSWLQAFGTRKEIIAQFDNLPVIANLNCLPPAGVLMWNTAIIKQLGYDEFYQKGSEDFDVVSRASTLGFRVAVIDKPTYFYRIHKMSTSSNIDPNLDLMYRANILEALPQQQDVFQTAIKLLVDSKSVHTSPFYWTPENKRFKLLKTLLILYGKLPLSLRQNISVLIRR
jgi:GT2 family glycosyltransferase